MDLPAILGLKPALIERHREIRKRLIQQAGDKIGMDDYQQQLRAYQEIILEVIDIQGEILECLGSK